MADVLVKPAFQSAMSDTGDTTRLGPTAFNAARLFSGGVNGQVVTRDTTSATGASWGSATTTVVTLTDGATPALDASLGSVFRLAAAGNRTIGIPTNATDGQKIVIEHFASGGTRTLSLNTGAGGFRFGSDIPSLSATASGKTDYIGAIYNGTDSRWDVLAAVKGF